MPRLGIAGQLSSMINNLKAQRKKHADALRSVDSIFEKLGIQTHLAEEAKPRRGRPPGTRGPGRPPKHSIGQAAAMASGKAKPRRGHRSKFATSGPDSILALVQAGGKSGCTTSEINKHWKGEGRSGDAYVALGQLVKAKKLKRENLKGQRGSRYTAS